MRKLHQLLPIIRQFLVTADNPYRGQRYACFATDEAAGASKLTYEESHSLQKAIERRLTEQANCRTIATVADRDGINTDNLSDPQYIAFRDAWLDELQAKFEADDTSVLDVPELFR